MSQSQGRILIVDDNVLNRMLLARALQNQGYTTSVAADGQQALMALRATPGCPFDIVLLDVLMPQLDGHQVLQAIKVDRALRDIPVIMISALDELDSIVHCIELGAEDYLTKPYEPALLRARISACLEKKRLRDQEVEYLRNVALVTSAAAAVESDTFEANLLAPVAGRDDALGRLARVFLRMAEEVHAREQRLRQQLEQLRIDIEERERATAETVSIYLPMDRRQALIHGYDLPDQTHGTALFADVSGFTPLTMVLAQEQGQQRGAEELTRQLNRVYGALIAQVHCHGGSVICFSGDAITCWFDDDDGLRATNCAVAMQGAMDQFSAIITPAGTPISLGIKVAVARGPVRRLLAGDPQTQHFEVLAGQTLQRLGQIEQLAERGEVLVQDEIAQALCEHIYVSQWRTNNTTGQRCALVTAVMKHSLQPWPLLPPTSLRAEQVRPWLLPSVYERVRTGTSSFLSELRPAAALFMSFAGIDFDNDPQAGQQFDQFIRWVQAQLMRHDGTLLQITFGDKGSYLYASFGAPTAHEDDAVRAATAALDLLNRPPELSFITSVGIGLAYGQMRAGAYGGVDQHTYGVIGERTNLASRLMQETCAEHMCCICDERIYQAARHHMRFEPLTPLPLKGIIELVPAYRLVGVLGSPPVAGQPQAFDQKVANIDTLPPTPHTALKLASVIGQTFRLDLLRALDPAIFALDCLEQSLGQLAQRGLIELRDATGQSLGQLAQRGLIELRDATGMFKDRLTREVAYSLLPFYERRRLHRAIAEWYEQTYATDLPPHYALVIDHLLKAEDFERGCDYLELAGQHARQAGRLDEAASYFKQLLHLQQHRQVSSA